VLLRAADKGKSKNSATAKRANQTSAREALFDAAFVGFFSAKIMG
jgi:hypothetical protein